MSFSLFYSLVQLHKWSSVTLQNIKLHRPTVSQLLLWTNHSPLPAYRFDWLMEHGKSTLVTFSLAICSKCCQPLPWQRPFVSRHFFAAESYTCFPPFWVEVSSPSFLYLHVFPAIFVPRLSQRFNTLFPLFPTFCFAAYLVRHFFFRHFASLWLRPLQAPPRKLGVE